MNKKFNPKEFLKVKLSIREESKIIGGEEKCKKKKGYKQKTDEKSILADGTIRL